jgi:hypothetical protein
MVSLTSPNYRSTFLRRDFYPEFHKPLTGPSSSPKSQLSINDRQVFPNPSSSFFKFSKKIDWQLFDLTGKQVLAGSGNQLDASALCEGFYLLKEIKTKRSVKLVVN